jgi:hypothetical protein
MSPTAFLAAHVGAARKKTRRIRRRMAIRTLILSSSDGTSKHRGMMAVIRPIS